MEKVPDEEAGMSLGATLKRVPSLPPATGNESKRKAKCTVRATAPSRKHPRKFYRYSWKTPLSSKCVNRWVQFGSRCHEVYTC